MDVGSFVREDRPHNGVLRPVAHGVVDQGVGVQVTPAEVADPDRAAIKSQAEPHDKAPFLRTEAHPENPSSEHEERDKPTRNQKQEK